MMTNGPGRVILACAMAIGACGVDDSQLVIEGPAGKADAPSTVRFADGAVSRIAAAMHNGLPGDCALQRLSLDQAHTVGSGAQARLVVGDFCADIEHGDESRRVCLQARFLEDTVGGETTIRYRYHTGDKFSHAYTDIEVDREAETVTYLKDGINNYFGAQRIVNVACGSKAPQE